MRLTVRVKPKAKQPFVNSLEPAPRQKSWEQRMTRGFGALYDQSETNDDRVTNLRQRVEYFLTIEPIAAAREQIEASLQRCLGAPDRESFIALAKAAVQPITDFQRDHYSEFQQRLREEFLEHNRSIPMNEILSYGEGPPGTIHVHLAPAEDIPNLLTEVKDGFVRLAALFNEHPEWQTVNVKSWIVEQHPRIVERLGFTLEPPREGSGKPSGSSSCPPGSTPSLGCSRRMPDAFAPGAFASVDAHHLPPTPYNLELRSRDFECVPGEDEIHR